MAKIEVENQQNEIMVIPPTNPISTWIAGDMFKALNDLATKFSNSQLVPTHFRGKPGDCFIAMQTAHRLKIDPFLALQNMNIINGKPGWSAPFSISLANERGFAEKIRFKITGSGESLEVEAYARLRDSDEIGKAKATYQMAKDEGWISNKKYKTMPEQMLCYRSATFLIRRYCPEVLNGMSTMDEVEDIHYSESRMRTVGSTTSVDVDINLDNLNKQIEDQI